MVDAFTVSWEKENLWMCPPLYLIGDVIRRVRSVPCHGTLIVPEWKSAWWWPLFFQVIEGHLLSEVGYTCPEREDYSRVVHAHEIGLMEGGQGVKCWQLDCAV